MQKQERQKMFRDVFAPKAGEKILFLVDTPHGNIKDNLKWKNRRKMAKQWFETFSDMGKKDNFSVDLFEYNATGKHNFILSENILKKLRKANLIIAMTEYSATSSIVLICESKGSISRGASMPLVEKRMENTSMLADYSKVSIYAKSIKEMLENSIAAEIDFSTGDKLFIDLRNRSAIQDSGDCTKTGNIINFPSGEACISPYEAASDEKDRFGESKTKGILPVMYKSNLLRFKIKNNKIEKIVGESKKAKELESFFNELKSRRNIAELGIGCNPKAVVTGNVLEDEKAGLHIAYGMSKHLGGKVDSDIHFDICYTKACPIEAKRLTLIYKNGKKVDLIKNSKLCYEMLD